MPLHKIHLCGGKIPINLFALVRGLRVALAAGLLWIFHALRIYHGVRAGTCTPLAELSPNIDLEYKVDCRDGKHTIDFPVAYRMT